PGPDKSLDRIADHRAVVDREQVLVGDQGERMQPAPGSARENDSFHCCRDSTGVPGTLCFHAMAAPPPSSSQTHFSADGFWWWDGAEWRAAYSQDRLWRWNGQGWVPAQTPAPPGAGGAVGLTVGLVAGFLGILVLVSIIVIVILLTMGNQLTN